MQVGRWPKLWLLLLLSGICWGGNAARAIQLTQSTGTLPLAGQPVSGEAAAGASATETPPTTGLAEDKVRPWVIPAKFFRHADRLMAKYGADGSGKLDRGKWDVMPKSLWAADRDGDGVITVDELAEHLFEYARPRSLEPLAQTWQAALEFLPLLRPSTPADAPASRGGQANGEQVTGDSGQIVPEPASPGRRQQGTRKFVVPPSRLPAGLPDWFTARDLDGDGQLTFGEFAPDGGRAALEQFERLDLNHDGVLTPEEVLQANKTTGKTKEGGAAGAK